MSSEIVLYRRSRKLLSTELDKLIFEYLSLIRITKRRWFINYVEKMPWLIDWVNHKTPKLSDPKFNITTKLQWIFDDRTDFPICPTCNKYYSTDLVFKSIGDYYQKHCSTRCSTLDVNVQNKMHNTCLRLYNVKNGGGSRQAIQKIKQTKLERYGDENYCNAEKIKQLHGNSKTNPEYWNNWRKSFKSTMGTKVTNPEFWESLNAKVKKTTIDRYGGIGYGSKILRKRLIEAERKKYGGVLYTQTHEYAVKRRKRLIYKNKHYDSLWEIEVVKFCENHNIAYEYQPNISFEYTFENKQHHYQPDFLINGKVYEVKGDHFFRINEATGEEEMYCPFKPKNTTAKEYDKICRKFNAKFKCMILNNVIILRKFEIDNLDKILLGQ